MCPGKIKIISHSLSKMNHSLIRKLFLSYAHEDHHPKGTVAGRDT